MILVVIVNYRCPGFVIDCLRSLYTEIAALPGAQVVVVDNDSGDDSVAQIRAVLEAERWGAWVRLMPLAHNGGFAFGNNAAIHGHLVGPNPAEYIWLLNPDTRVRPGALRTLVEFMERHPRVGIAGSQLEDFEGHVERSAHLAPSLLSELYSGARLGILSRLLNGRAGDSPQRAHACEWVSGASMIIRRGVFDSIGVFDDGYFLYYEEVDFCYRAQRAGWGVWHVPAACVLHLEGASTRIRHCRRPEYWFDSRRRYFVKHHGACYAGLADLARLAGLAVWHLRRLVTGVPDNDPPRFFSDFVRYSLRTMLRPAARGATVIGRRPSPGTAPADTASHEYE